MKGIGRGEPTAPKFLTENDSTARPISRSLASWSSTGMAGRAVRVRRVALEPDLRATRDHCCGQRLDGRLALVAAAIAGPRIGGCTSSRRQLTDVNIDGRCCLTGETRCA
jgi:hypothetical protein